jgi:hypothetical protein
MKDWKMVGEQLGNSSSRTRQFWPEHGAAIRRKSLISEQQGLGLSTLLKRGRLVPATV